MLSKKDFKLVDAIFYGLIPDNKNNEWTYNTTGFKRSWGEFDFQQWSVKK